MFSDGAGYHDIHAWHFVPSSFELLLLELAWLGETDWQVERMASPGGWEFFAWLRRKGKAKAQAMTAEDLQAARLLLLKRTLLEGQAQVEWLPDVGSELAAARCGALAWACSETSPTLPMEDGEVATLRKQLAASEARQLEAVRCLAAMKASTSWRVTAPLRSVATRLWRRQEKA